MAILMILVAWTVGFAVLLGFDSLLHSVFRLRGPRSPWLGL